MRIGSSIQPKVYSQFATQDVARSPQAQEAQAQAVLPLQRHNPALQAFKGESGFDGPAKVSSTPRSPALKAFQGVSGFDGPGAAHGAVQGKEAPVSAKAPSRGPGFGAPELPDYIKALIAAIGNV
jgi:hypothetical protein